MLGHVEAYEILESLLKDQDVCATVIYEHENGELSSVEYFLEELVCKASFHDFDFRRVSKIEENEGTDENPHKIYYNEKQ